MIFGYTFLLFRDFNYLADRSHRITDACSLNLLRLHRFCSLWIEAF